MESRIILSSFEGIVISIPRGAENICLKMFIVTLYVCLLKSSRFLSILMCESEVCTMGTSFVALPRSEFRNFRSLIESFDSDLCG